MYRNDRHINLLSKIINFNLLHIILTDFSSSSCSWYFRKIKRIEAEKKLLLPENEHGAFLIRDSESRHNDYSLSGKVIFFLSFLISYWSRHKIGKCKSLKWIIFRVNHKIDGLVLFVNIFLLRLAHSHRIII